MTEFTERVIEIISSIPTGRVMTYGTVAICAGSPGGARQVVRILHTQTEKYQLPWQRVISTGGYLKIRDPKLHHLHKMLLLNEGIEFVSKNQLDLAIYGWQPEGFLSDNFINKAKYITLFSLFYLLFFFLLFQL